MITSMTRIIQLSIFQKLLLSIQVAKIYPKVIIAYSTDFVRHRMDELFFLLCRFISSNILICPCFHGTNFELSIQNHIIAPTQKNISTERRFPRRSFRTGHFRTKVKGVLPQSCFTIMCIFRPFGRI